MCIFENGHKKRSPVAVLLWDEPSGFTHCAVWGVVNLMEGYGNDNPGAKSQGIKQLMAGGGVVLIGTTLIPLLSGLFG